MARTDKDKHTFSKKVGRESDKESEKARRDERDSEAPEAQRGYGWWRRAWSRRKSKDVY